MHTNTSLLEYAGATAIMLPMLLTKYDTTMEVDCDR